MFCQHPTCSLEAITTCKYHCQLTVCQQHRLEHETSLLNTLEKQLDDLSNPISSLLSKVHYDLQQSEESRQRDLDRINSVFDRHSSSINQSLKLVKKSNELIATKREQFIHYKTGENQLTKDDYQQIETLANQIETSLQEQAQFNNQNNKSHLSTIEKEHAVPREIECIELSDSDDDLPQNTTKIDSRSSNSHGNRSIDTNKKRETTLSLVRDFCPLTQFGVYGLDTSHNISRLCSEVNNTSRYLYQHFTRFHRIQSKIAYQLVKAVRNGYNPMETKIFPSDHKTSSIVENISCPFDSSARKFNEENSIPNTPCNSSCAHHGFKEHLRKVHTITKINTELIFNAMKDYGSISHVQFEEDLCEN